MILKGELKKETPRVESASIDYRSYNALNQSMIKTYLSNPKRFYEEFVLKKKRKEKDTASLLLGSLMDCILVKHRARYEDFERNFEEDFSLFDGIKGSGQAFVLAEEIWNLSQDDLNEDNTFNTNFMDRFERAFAKVQADGKYSKKTLEWALDDFSKSPASEWLKSKFDSVGKKVVDVSLIDKSKKIYDKVMEIDSVKHVFTGNDNIEQIGHFVIDWEYSTLFDDKINCKSELDTVHFDHEKKQCRIFDLKTSYDNENFAFSFLKYRYDLQSLFYTLALRFYLDNNGMKDYEILPFRFVVLDTSPDNMQPLIYELSNEDLFRAKFNYTVNGYEYEGLFPLMEEINWSLKNGVFDISKEAYENGNIMPLNIAYGNK